jgi:TonB-linked SusC/RagA family outer membrane protein
MKHIFTHLAFIALSLSVAGSLTAQQAEPVDSSARADSVAPQQAGRLFSVPARYGTAAVSSVSGETLSSVPSAQSTGTLIGRLPGLYVRESSGEPKGVPAAVQATLMNIRGRGTYGMVGNEGYNTMKIFVDGFETNLNYFLTLPAADILQVSILKDAAALATFGMRGDEGVLWVTTKRGAAGDPVVRFQARSGLQQPIDLYKPLGSYDYARLYNEAFSNDQGNRWTPRYSETQLDAYKNGTGTDVDWYDQVLKSASPYYSGNLSFSGGNPLARYRVALDYLNQQGLYQVANTDETSNEMLKRYNIRANLDFNLFHFFEARIDLSGNLTDHKGPNFGTEDLWENMGRYPANIYPVLADSAKWSGTALYPNNPVASIKALGWNSGHYRNLLGNFGLREKLDFITPGLYLDESYSFNSYGSSTYSKTATYARYYDGATTTTDKTTPIKAQPQTPAGQEDLKQFQMTLGYQHASGDNRLQAAVNYYQSNYMGDGLIFYATHYQNVSGRVHYVYQGRFVGEAAFSAYGSDAFAPGHRWGFYPAVSAAWILSEESFLKDSHVLSFLKLRASAGLSGGIDDSAYQSGRYLYQQYYQAASISGGSFYMGDANPAGAPMLDPLYTANPDVFAERSLKYNVGVDLTLLHRITLSVDAFLDKRSHILTADNATPEYFGYNISYKNIGRVTNQGFEVSGKYTGGTARWGYSLFGMAAFNKNRIDYMAETPPAHAYNGLTGRAIGTPIGLVATGYYQLDDFKADGTLKDDEPVPAFGAVQPGDLKYRDLDGDGKIDQTDVTASGHPAYPQLTYSFGGDIHYGGWGLTAFFTGAEGADVDLLSAARTQVEAFVDNGNVFPLAENAWAYYPDQGIDRRASATYPRLTTQANNNNYRSSTYWIKSGDFLRLRQLELGYDFASHLRKTSMLSGLRISVSATNLVTWSTLLKNYHLDPETWGGYPAMKSYNLGISATF